MIDFRKDSPISSWRKVQGRPMGVCSGLAQLGTGAEFASLNINHLVLYTFRGILSAAYCRDFHVASPCYSSMGHQFRFFHASEDVCVKHCLL